MSIFSDVNKKKLAQTLITILIIGGLLSSSISPGFANTLSKSPEMQKSPVNKPISHTLPSEYPIPISASGDQILMYDTFELRDKALTQLPTDKIEIVYDLIPAIAMKSLSPNEIFKEGLKSVTPDVTFTKQSNPVQVDLKDYSVDSFTLRETANMIGIKYLRDILGLDGSGITIGILDSGVNSTLKPFDNRVTRYVVPELSNKGSLDQDGHGTHVAGIAAGNGEFKINGKWVQTDSPGMAPKAEIHSIRVLDEVGNGDNSWIVEGMEEAIKQNVDIISMSLSTDIFEGQNDPMKAMVEVANEKGIAIVAAAGNTGPIGSAIGIPGALDGVIAVGASFPTGESHQELWSFSSIGPAINDYPGPDFIAPGAKILSVDAGSGKPTRLSGTSMATPHVSGGIALLEQAFPSASVTQIREALLASSQLTFNSNGALDQVEGQGRGQVRFDIAYYILNETLVNSNSHVQMPVIPSVVKDSNYFYRDRLINHPKELPFFIFSSRNATIKPVVNSTYTEWMEFDMPEYVNLTVGINRINIRINITSPTVNFTRGQVFFVENSTGIILPNAYIFFESNSRFTESRVLFDTSHDFDTPSGYFGNQGPTGQYSQLSGVLEEQGQIIESSGGEELTPAMLSNYDVLIIGNPDGKYAGSEISAVKDFMAQGKSVWIIVSGGLLSAEGEPTFPQFNREDLNSILSATGISIPSDTDTPFSTKSCDFSSTSYNDRESLCVEDAEFVSSQSIIDHRIKYPHFGPQLEVNDTSLILARSGSNIVAATAQFQSGGRVAVISSTLPFDNYGIMYGYSSSESADTNREITLGIFNWLVEPRQAKMVVSMSNEVGTSFNAEMYEKYLIRMEPYDKDGHLINLGPQITVSVSEFRENYGLAYGKIPFVQLSDGFYYFEYTPIVASHLKFYYHFSPPGSIPSDSHFEIDSSLRLFNRQSDIRQVNIIVFLLFLTSWIFWLTNEGGRELWMKKKEAEAQSKSDSLN